MNIKLGAIILMSILGFGCGPKTTPPVAIPVAPKATESVQPTFKKVQKGIEDTVKSNEKIDRKLRETTEAVNNQNLEIKEALSQAEKIKEKALANQLITELEATNLVVEIQKVQARNMFLELSVKELEKIRLEQMEVLKGVKMDSHDTLIKLLAKEQETLDLRNHGQFLATNLQAKNKEVVDLQKHLEKEKVKAASAGVYKKWVIGLVVGFVLWTILKNVIMLYSPVKFRI